MDFSQGALNALDYAIDIARNFQSLVRLVWVDTSSIKSESGVKNEVRHDAKLELQSIIEQKTQENEGLDIDYKLRKGKVYQEISSVVKSCNADMLVIGTHGISGFEEFWIGSNAFKIISYSPCPVISVPTIFNRGGVIKTIILPIDDTFDTTKKVPMATDLAIAFKADIQMLAVHYTDLGSIRKKTDINIRETERFLLSKGIKPKYKSCTVNTNISTSIVKYANGLDADLIVIMTDQNKATSNILMGLNSQQILNSSIIPILSVKPGKMEF